MEFAGLILANDPDWKEVVRSYGKALIAFQLAEIELNYRRAMLLAYYERDLETEEES